MPQFRYRAVTHAGEIVVGEAEAASCDEVVRRIKYLGHLPIDTTIVTSGAFARGGGIGRKAPRSRDVTIFLRQLALLIAAGLTLEAAQQSLGDDTSKALAWFAGTIRTSISAGDSFAEALERHSAIIEPAYVAMVRAGEASGKLEPVLRAIVEDRTRRELLADRINSAIRYPLFLVGSAVVVLLFFLIYVVPQFEPVFKDLGGRLNAGAAFVLAASAWLRGNLDLLSGLGLALIPGIWLVAGRRELRARIVSAFASIPGVSGAMRDRRTARIVGTLGLLVANGVALPAALKILRDVVTGPHYVAVVDGVYEQVRNGRRFGEALAETDLLPPLAVRMLRVGDETGDLPSIATHTAQFYEHKLGIGLDRLMGSVGPVTIVLVSLVIGALIISIMSALLSITELAL
jgi:general secretion pathway protein F